MSSVDERVVEMKFENHLFDKNVTSSISAIEKLKTALNFDGVGKSISEVERSVNSVDFSKLSANVESLSSRFSGWGIAGMTVIQDLTRAAENLGKSMYNATIGQIKSGGWARATNIDQAKFKLQGLEVEWDKISEDINYGVDNTAYGLDAAATAASQLVASGVEYGEAFGETGNSPMAKALRGISGVAAMTSSSYEEISSIFTTVAGQGKLMTMQLRQLESRGLNAAAKLGEVLGYTEEEIRDMVTKGQINFATFSEAMDEAFGEHASKANDTFEGALSNMKSALSRIGQNFATPIRKNMTDIFNAIRPLINVLNKEKFTQIYADFEDFAAKASGFVQHVLNNIDLSFIDDIVDKLHDAYLWFDTLMTAVNPYWKAVEEEEEAAAEATTSNTKAMEEYQAVVERVRNGEYGNGDERNKKLEEEGYNWKVVQNMVNEAEGIDFRYAVTEEELAAAIGEKNEALEGTADAMSKGQEASKNAALAYAEQQKAHAKQLEQERKQQKMQVVINELLEKTKPITEGLSSAFNILTNTLKAAFEGGFDPALRIFSALGNIVLDVLGVVGRGFTALDKWMTETGAYAKIQEGINTVLSTFADIFEGIAGFIGDITSEGGFLPDLFGWLGNGEITDGVADMGDVFAMAVDKIGKFFTALGEYISSDGAEGISGFIDNLSTIFPVLSKLWPLLLEVGKGFIFFKGTKALGSILDTITLFPKAIKANIREKNTTSLLKLAAAIGVIAFAFYQLSKLSWAEVGRAAVAIVAIGAALGGLFLVITKAGSGKGLLGSIQGYMNSLATENNANSILKIAGAFGVLALSMLALSQLSWEQLAIGAIAILTLTGALTVLMVVFMKMRKSQSLVRVTNPLSAFAGAIQNVGVSMGKFIKNLGTAALITSIGIAVLAIGKTIAILAEIPWEDSLKACGFIAIILLELIGAMVLVKKLGGGVGGVKTSITMLALAKVLQMLGGVVQDLSKTSWDSGLRACAILGLMMLELIGTMALLSVVGKKGGLKKSVMLLALAKAIQMLGEVVMQLSTVSWDAGFRACLILGAMLAELAGAMAIMSTIGKKNGLKKSIMLLAVAKAIQMLGDVVVQLSAVSWDGGFRACIMLGLMLGELAGAMIIMSTIGKKNGLKKSVMLLVVAQAIQMLGDVVVELSKIPLESGIMACILLGAMLLELSGAMAILSIIGKKGGIMKSIMMLALAATVEMLGDVVVKLSAVSWGDGIKACVLLGALMLELVGAMALLSLLGKKGGLKKSIQMLALGATVQMLGDVVVNISSVSWGDGIKSVSLIGLLLLELVGTMFIASKVSSRGNMISMGIFLGSFAAAIKSISSTVVELSAIDEASLDKAIGAIAKISALTAGLLVVTKFTGGKGTDIKGVIPTILMIAALVGATYVLAQMDPTSLESATKAISKLMSSLSKVMLASNIKIGKGHNTKSTIVQFAGLAVLLAEAAAIFYLLQDLDPDHMLKMSEAFAGVFDSLAVLGVAVGAISTGGFVSTVAGGAGGVVVLDILLANMLAIATIAAAIEDNFPEFKNFIAKGAPLLKAVGETFGEVIGGFLSKAIFDPLADSLSKVGPSFQTFTDAIGPFLTSTEEYDTSGLETLKEALGIIVGIEAEGLLSSVLSALQGESGMKKMASELDLFADSLISYSSKVKDNIDEDAIKASTDAGQMLSDFANALPKHGGLKQWITGDATLTSFAEEMDNFAPALKRYSDSVSGENAIDTKAVAASARAGRVLSSLAKNLPTNKNILEYWFGGGQMTLSEFGNSWGDFGKALCDYSHSIVENGGIDEGAVEASASAGQVLASLANNLPSNKSILGVFFGGNKMDLSEFAGTLGDFGSAIAAYSRSVSGDNKINTQAVRNSANAGKVLASLADALPRSGGVLDMLFGEKMSFSNFGDGIVDFGHALKEYADSVTGDNAIDSTAVENTANAGKVLASVAEALPRSGGVLDMLFGEKMSFSNFGDGIVEFGHALKEYADSVTGDNKIDSTAVKNTANAGKVLASLAEALPRSGGVLDMLFGERMSFSNFGDGIIDFGHALKEYADSVTGDNAIDSTAVEDSARAGEVLASLASALPRSGGVLDMLFGERMSFSNFGQGISDFGQALVDYSNVITGANEGKGIDSDAVKASADAGSILASLAGSLPRNGGVLDALFGERMSFSNFGDGIIDFANALIDYSNTITHGGEDGKGVDTAAIEKSAAAAQLLSDLANGLPNNHSKLDWFFGGQMNLDEFGNQLELFAPHMVAYSHAITANGGIDSTAIEDSANAATLLANFANIVPDTGGLLSFFTGDNSLATFADDLSTLGWHLRKFSEFTTAVDMAPGLTAVQAVSDLIGVLDTLNANAGTTQMEQAEVKLLELEGQISGIFNAFAVALEDVDDKQLVADAAAAINGINTVIDNIKGIDETTLQTFNDNLFSGITEEGFAKTITNRVEQIAKSIITKITDVFISEESGASMKASISNLFSDVLVNLGETEESFKTEGSNFVTKMGTGARLYWRSLSSAISTVLGYAKRAAEDFEDDFKVVGKNLTLGVKHGIEEQSVVDQVLEAVRKLCRDSIQAAKNELKEESPSRVFRQIGAYMSLGAALGIQDETDTVVDSASATALAAVGAMSENMNTGIDEMAKEAGSSLAAAYHYINQVVQDSMDANPVITPVLDMSMIQNGMNSMNGMWGGYDTNGNPLMYARGLFPGSYTYTSSGQAMTQYEIVNAINAMRSDIKDLGGAMSNMQMVLDSGALVGQLAPGTDRQLGNIAKYKERWA